MNQESLGRFVQLFTLDDATATQHMSERLELVLRAPADYQAQYAEELAERGIVAALPEQELRDVALVDALLAEDLAWESDWNDKASAIAEGLNDILTQQNRPNQLQLRALTSRRETGPEALDALQDALEFQGLALVLFTLDSDSYPLGVVADAQVEALRKLAAHLEFNLVVY